MPRLHRPLPLLLFFALLLGTLMVVAAPQQGGPVEWKSIQQAIDQGLPKTAIERLDVLIRSASAAGDVDLATRAIATRATLKGQLEGGGEETRILELQGEIESADASTRPVLRAILAEWFWAYYEQNQWRFRDRTSVASSDEPGSTEVKSAEDLKTWDRQKIVARAKELFESALADGEMLKAQPIANWTDLLTDGTAPDAYRPTLVDFLVERAIDFYVDAESTYAGPVNRFSLPAASPVLDDAKSFLTWRVPDNDLDSPLRRATALYQDWLRFHVDDEDPSALIDADFHRIEFAAEKATGVGKAERVTAAWRSFAAKNSEHPIAARASLALATEAFENDDLTTAHQIASAAVAKHADSFGGRSCAQLIALIERPSIDIRTPRVWNPDADPQVPPTIEVTAKNAKRLYFRLVQMPTDAQSLVQPGQNNVTRSVLQRVVGQRAAHQWDRPCPDTPDFQTRSVDVQPPAKVAKGRYILLASSDPTFPIGRGNENVGYTAATEVWVSSMSMVVQTRYGNGLVDGWLVDGRTGSPLSGVGVQAWGYTDRSRRGNRTAELLGSLRTDADGRFSIAKPSAGVMFLAQRGDDQLVSQSRFSIEEDTTDSRPSRRGFFFTDRAIYRPGQTIRYKVIATSAEQTQNDYAVITDQNLTIEFIDANGQTIATQTKRTNSLGSVSGDFQIPDTGLTGRMRLQVRGDVNGQTFVSVEEYKRPKFEVTIEQPDESVGLGQTVTLSGRATAYTGAAIDGAAVKYRVVRQTRYPGWWFWRCWWMPPSQPDPQTIIESTATTDATGRFAIEFDAVADPTVDAESQPTFRYTVTADVIDTTGETRTGTQTIVVGYTLMTASMSVADSDWLTTGEPVSVDVTTRTLQEQPVSSPVQVRVFSLKQPERIGGDGRFVNRRPPEGDDAAAQVIADDPNTWPIGQPVGSFELTTDVTGNASFSTQLAAGHYRAELTAVDSAGQPVTAMLPLRVIDPAATKCELAVPAHLSAAAWTAQPEDTFTAVWGSGFEAARAVVEVEHRGKLLQRYWTPVGQTQVKINQAIDESLRGGFTIRVTMVHDNQLHLSEQFVDVPWTNKAFSIRWEKFTSKLKPGGEATWTAIVEGPGSVEGDAKARAAVEMVAALYDASLDVFARHDFLRGFGVFYRDYGRTRTSLQDGWYGLREFASFPYPSLRGDGLSYRSYPSELAGESGRFYMKSGRGMGRAMPMMMSVGEAAPASAPAEIADENVEAYEISSGVDSAPPDSPATPDIDLSGIPPRTNLSETAFFFPNLIAGDDGRISMQFTMPEALTRWRLLGFAHTRDLASGAIDDTAVTSKDLMVQPNPPRVLRAGDEIEFTVKVSNQSATAQTGQVSLAFRDARTNDSVDESLANTDSKRSFDIPAGQSTTLSWRINVPDDLNLLTYTAVASTGRLSDGEEGYLPVLSRRVLVHESIAMAINGQETKTFLLEKLLGSEESRSIDTESLTVQMTSNPSWYAVMALPYLMEFPHECVEQSFNRLYANALARHIATSDPKIERVFETWRRQRIAAGRETLASPLQQNESLKQIALVETPWVAESISEAESRRNVGLLFDRNRVDNEIARIQQRLAQTQLPDGGWSWFPGGRMNPFMTAYLIAGYGRLRHLGVDLDVQSAVKANAAMDSYLRERYQRIAPEKRGDNQLDPLVALILYGRTFFPEHRPSDPAVMNYWIDQTATHWLSLGSRMSQGHVALAMHRLGKLDIAAAITRSLVERSVTDEMGMHWNDPQSGWFWHQAVTESQAMMIEVLDEVAGDAEAVQRCQAWLLRQKETRAWQTTKATADAVYALLLRGTDKLADDQLVDVTVGDDKLPGDDVEAGTGFTQTRWDASQVTPAMGRITVTKTTPGIAWGGVHWQYFQNIDEVTPHAGTPLEVEKQVFVIRRDDAGATMVPVGDQPLAVGDELVSRLVVRTSRDMEFIHLKDHRGSGTEPVNVLSGYRNIDGVAVYQSTRDSAEHFFIDFLPKGTVVIESKCRIQLRGEYQTGLATIESMYAPQFNSHSESTGLDVQ